MKAGFQIILLSLLFAAGIGAVQGQPKSWSEPVAATVMTLGMAVIAPTQLAPTAQQAHVDPRHLVLGPTEVAILPAKIDVVASREKSAQRASPYLPAAYKSRS